MWPVVDERLRHLAYMAILRCASGIAFVALRMSSLREIVVGFCSMPRADINGHPSSRCVVNNTSVPRLHRDGWCRKRSAPLSIVVGDATGRIGVESRNDVLTSEFVDSCCDHCLKVRGRRDAELTDFAHLPLLLWIEVEWIGDARVAPASPMVHHIISEQSRLLCLIAPSVSTMYFLICICDHIPATGGGQWRRHAAYDGTATHVFMMISINRK